MTFKPLKPGAAIALVAPSSPFDGDKFDRAARIIEDHGYKLSPGKYAFNRNGYLAGSEAERTEDIVRAFTDPAVAAVVCVRGGYGSGRLLPWIPFPSIKKHLKIFPGHSDITFLHLAFHRRMGWCTFHGPNLTGLENPVNIESVLATLRGENDFSWDIDESLILRRGAAVGKVLGGNLTCMSHLIGTPYLPDLTGALLLVEDCNEAPYRLDRMFTQLKLAGIIDRLGGLILGQFKDCGDYRKVLDLAMDTVKSTDFPVVAGLPFGHEAENQVIPLGIPFSLNTDERTLRPVQSPFAA